MATGDDAIAAGMDVVDGATTLASTVDTEINKTRDYIAQRTSTVTPVSKGGTGATSAGAARTNLGLGSAATKDATTSPSVGDVVLYGGSGRINVGTPTSNGNATTKEYVDTTTYNRSTIDYAFDLRDSDITDIRAGLLTSAVYNRDLGGVTRRVTWTSDAGQLGYASSLREHKQDITPAALAKSVLRQIPIVQYRYKAQVALQQQDPEHHVAVEIGTLADDLHALGLWQFVTYDGHGEDAAPQGVHYELLGLAAIALGQILADELDAVRVRLDSIEDRLAVLEG